MPYTPVITTINSTDQVKNSRTTINTNFNELLTAYNTWNNDIAYISGEIVDYEAFVVYVSGEVDRKTWNEDRDYISGEVNKKAWTTDLNYLSGRITINIANINYVSGELATTIDNVDNLDSDVTFLSSEIDITNNNVDNLDYDVTFLSGQIDNKSTQINNLDADVTFLSSEILLHTLITDTIYLSSEIDKKAWNTDLLYVSAQVALVSGGSGKNYTPDITFLSAEIDLRALNTNLLYVSAQMAVLSSGGRDFMPEINFLSGEVDLKATVIDLNYVSGQIGSSAGLDSVSANVNRLNATSDNTGNKSLLTLMTTVSSAAIAVYTNPANTVTHIKHIQLHNTNTTNELVKIWNVPNNGVNIGIPNDANRTYCMTISSNDTISLEHGIGMILQDANDTIQASTTTNEVVTLMMYGFINGDEDRVTEITTLSAITKSVYTNAASTTAFIKDIILHNTHPANTENVKLWYVPNSSGNLGTAANTNRMYNFVMDSQESTRIEFPEPGIILSSTNDSIQGQGTTSAVTIQAYGRII